MNTFSTEWLESEHANVLILRPINRSALWFDNHATNWVSRKVTSPFVHIEGQGD